jgi:hypothetical protein
MAFSSTEIRGRGSTRKARAVFCVCAARANHSEQRLTSSYLICFAGIFAAECVQYPPRILQARSTDGSRPAFSQPSLSRAGELNVNEACRSVRIKAVSDSDSDSASSKGSRSLLEQHTTRTKVGTNQCPTLPTDGGMVCVCLLAGRYSLSALPMHLAVHACVDATRPTITSVERMV